MQPNGVVPGHADELTDVHAAAARDLVGRRKLSIHRFDAIFMHGLLGNNSALLAQMALVVLGTRMDNLPHLAEASNMLRRYTTISGQFPEPSPLHATLRATQILLLAVSREGPEFTKAIDAFEQEIAAAPAALDDDVPSGDHLRLLLWGRVLQIEGVIELLADLPDACLRLGEVSRRLKINLVGLPSAAGVVVKDVSVEAFLFHHQLCHAETVTNLIRTFTALKRRPAAERAALLESLRVEPFSHELAVRNPWMREFRKNQKGTPELAEEYQRFADLVDAPDEKGLYEGAIDTAAIILDEDLGLADRALSIVEHALIKHTHSTRLRRSLSRIYWHMERYEDQLRAGLPLLGVDGLGSVDQAYLRRELAIGLSKLGRHAEAARLLREGASYARTVSIEGMTNMATGLLADAGVQFVWAGDGPSALVTFAEALHAVDADRDSREFDDVALRKLFAHSVMWARLRLLPRPAAPDQVELAMVAGANSSPNKASDLEDQPSGPIEVAWYVLADMEEHFGVDLGIGRAITGPSWDERAILSMEADRRLLQLRTAIAKENAEALREALPGFVDASELLQEVGPDAVLGRPGKPLQFRRGRIPALSEAAFAAVRGAFGKIPLAVFLRKVFKGEVEEALNFLKVVTAGSRPVFSSDEADMIRRGGPPATNSPTLLAAALMVAQAVRTGTTPGMNGLLVVTVRLIENDADPHAGGVLASAEHWMFRWWRDVLERQAFRLRTPVLARRSFDAVMALDLPVKEKLSRLVLDLEPFLNLRLSADLRRQFELLLKQQA